ncbi:MAG: tyrosine-type recombinase/integrase [Pirellulaceae bacterium]|nr:tyrosine-type recombinase/integrase [Pirellulaceae bacterium]
MLSNRNRDHFVSQDDAERVLQACPDVEWRLLFALSRFGGLRCPSEHLALTWDCIDWERNRMLVRSPKTEHHEGHAERWVPLFPELRPHLEAAFDAALPGATHVITRYRDANANLRTQLCRIVRRAGLSPWPKLFQNLRASRATELAAAHPAHVAAAWLGHSQLIARKHYWQVTDEDFERAVQRDAESDARRAPNAAQQDARTVSQNQAQAFTSQATCANRRESVRDSAQVFSGDGRTRTCTPCGTGS